MSGLLFFLFLFSFLTASASTKQGQVYIVYLGEHAGAKSKETIFDDHHALLLSVKGSEEEARASLLYSYKHSLNGFAALLSDDEATKLSERTEVVSTFRSDGRWSPHTTRSWEFVGLEEGLRGLDSRDWLPSAAHAGENVIVGMLDSGIWPESRSFGDEGLGPVPARWKGVCQGGDSFNSSSCNRSNEVPADGGVCADGSPANSTVYSDGAVGNLRHDDEPNNCRLSQKARTHKTV